MHIPCAWYLSGSAYRQDLCSIQASMKYYNIELGRAVHADDWVVRHRGGPATTLP